MWSQLLIRARRWHEWFDLSSAHQQSLFSLYPLFSENIVFGCMRNIICWPTFLHLSIFPPVHPSELFPALPLWLYPSVALGTVSLHSYYNDENLRLDNHRENRLCSSQLRRLSGISMALVGAFTINSTLHGEEEANCKLDSQKSRLRSEELCRSPVRTLYPFWRYALVSLRPFSRFHTIFLHNHPGDQLPSHECQGANKQLLIHLFPHWSLPALPALVQNFPLTHNTCP